MHLKTTLQSATNKSPAQMEEARASREGRGNRQSITPHNPVRAPAQKSSGWYALCGSTAAAVIARMKSKARPHWGAAAWFVTTAVLVLIAIILSALLVAAVELRWGGDAAALVSDQSSLYGP